MQASAACCRRVGRWCWWRLAHIRPAAANRAAHSPTHHVPLVAAQRLQHIAEANLARPTHGAATYQGVGGHTLVADADVADTATLTVADALVGVATPRGGQLNTALVGRAHLAPASHAARPHTLRHAIHCNARLCGADAATLRATQLLARHTAGRNLVGLLQGLLLSSQAHLASRAHKPCRPTGTRARLLTPVVDALRL
jgi:hypothetical protein